MEDKDKIIEPLIERLEEFLAVNFELVILKTIKKTAVIASNFTSRALAIIFILMFLFIASIGVALWIGNQIGSIWYGFYIVGGFYGVLGFALLFFAQSLISQYLKQLFIKALFN